jgi:protein-S-isoprenylcysteine O-methyltransferase Ste14
MDARSRYDSLYLPLKAVTALALGYFAWRVMSDFLQNGHALLLLVLVSELITVGLVLIAPRPKHVVLTPRSILLTNAATFYFLLVSLKPGTQMLPNAVLGMLMLFGILLQIASKITLGRSFGLLPAMRGIVVRGPYRLVRHPIYLGYLCTHVGFFFFAMSWHNAFVYALLYACQVGRILEEERVLARSPEYRAYMHHVRYRLIPGLC